MKIIITGINGYLGNLLSFELRNRNHKVKGISRHLLYGSVEALSREIQNCDVIINLAGASILRRWTAKNKKLIYDSRVKTTNNLVAAIRHLPANKRAKKFISASAIGIYETGIQHDETSKVYENGFLGRVCREWEAVLSELPDGIQTNICRIALVLGKDSGIIKKMLPVFKLGLGGTLGSGKQAFPFIHEKDIVRAFIWLTEEFEQNAVINMVAPEQISNYDFTKALAKKLNKPAVLPLPGFILRIVFGKAADIILKSPIPVPQALVNEGFRFNYPTLSSLIDDIC